MKLETGVFYKNANKRQISDELWLHKAFSGVMPERVGLKPSKCGGVSWTSIFVVHW